MKSLLSLALLLCFTLFQAQLKKADLADFYNWTSDDGVHYQFILVSEQVKSMGVEAPAIIRVRYSLDGGVSYKIAEFDANFSYEEDKNSDDLIVNIRAGKTARIVEGTGSYIPDNFTLHFDRKGNYLKGYQVDHDELQRSNATYAKVFATPNENSDHMRKLIRLFYQSSEPMYRDLMLLAAQFD